MNNSLIITGASGFIGSHIMSFIKSLNISFLGFSRQKNYNNLQWTKDYMDIGLKADKNQICIHLAGNNIISSMDDSEIELTKYLADLFGSNLVYISSSYVYGKNHKSLITELDSLDAVNNYSRRKALCEEIVINNSGSVLRLSNVYGSGMTNNIFNHIYKEFMSQNKIVKINNALNTRDFIHVSDICSAITTYITDIKSGIYNIGTGEGTSIKDLCNIFAAKLKVNKSAYHVKSISQDDTMLVLDSNKFRNSYNWEPKINIDAGIEYWIRDYKRELSDAK